MLYRYMTHPTSYAIEWPTTLLLIISPLVALLGGIAYHIHVGFAWYHLATFIVLALLTGISITAGYHRLWAHKTYEAHPLVRLALALLGAATYQNSILIWASQHRRHHLHVDNNDKDPYSAGKGLWFSHMGWLLRRYPNNEDDFGNSADLEADPIVAWQHKHYYVIALLMNLVPLLILGALTGEYMGFLLIGFMRIVYTHHTTFFINSLAHYWGKQPYTSTNSARDNGLLSLLTFGEGYHNYHHMFQSDYRNGVRWYQFDPTKWLIKTLSWLRLADKLKTIPTFKIREALVNRQLQQAQTALQNKPATATVHDYIERELTQFGELLDAWRHTRAEWFTVQRQRLDDAKNELKLSMEKHTLNARLQELEHALQLQYLRLRRFNAGLV